MTFYFNFFYFLDFLNVINIQYKILKKMSGKIWIKIKKVKFDKDRIRKMWFLKIEFHPYY
jgi:hypothetical protein